MVKGVFGLPGCGKSTYLQKLATKYSKKGYKVYSVGADFDGAETVPIEYFGHADLSNSLILIDEISLFFDNRDFKSLKKAAKEFFILHRHYHCDIVWATQQFDGVDRKVRELTACLSRLTRIGPFTLEVPCKWYIFMPTRKILQNSPSAEIHTTYIKPGALSMLPVIFSPKSYTFRPLYYRKFDSFVAPELTPLDTLKSKNIIRKEKLL